MREPVLEEPLDSLFLDLLSAEQLLHRHAQPTGDFFWEGFAGCKIVTIAMLGLRIPCICPWTIEHGERFNILSQGDTMLRVAASGRLSGAHLATPCQSQSFGRLPPVRAQWCVEEGLPGLHWRDQELVDTGTEMVHWSVSFLQALHDAGGYGSLENPLFSWTWWHQRVVALWANAGWATACFPMQQYGAPYVKDTLVLHNSPMLHKLDKGHSVTKPEVVLRGKIFYNNEWRWRTSMTAAYRPDLAKDMAWCHSYALQARFEAHLENAPTPHAISEMDFGLPSAFTSDDASGTPEECAGLSTAADQVPYGGGANRNMSKEEHVAWALKQPHRLNAKPVQVPDTLREAIACECSMDDTVLQIRLGGIQAIHGLAHSLSAARDEWMTAVPICNQITCAALHGPSIAKLAEVWGFPDESLFEHITEGLPVASCH